MTYDAFNSRVGTNFTAEVAPEGAAQLTLVECTPAQRSGGYVSFTLTFRGAANQPLAQGAFRLSADGFQPTEVFIVPTGATDDGIDYEAVFNQRED